MFGQEIERKWLVSGFPEGVKPFDAYWVSQNYLIADEKEVRVRRAVPKDGLLGTMSPYKMTFKGPGTFSRKEIEFELSEDQYERALEFIDPNYAPVVKDFRKYRHDGYIIEISKVDNCWYYAEVEFCDKQEMVNYLFPWPELILNEVTYDPAYKMKNYWKSVNHIV